MKVAEMRKKTIPALEKHAQDLRVKIVDTKKAVVMAEESNHQSVGKMKKELAATLTIINELKSKETENK